MYYSHFNSSFTFNILCLHSSILFIFQIIIHIQKHFLSFFTKMASYPHSPLAIYITSLSSHLTFESHISSLPQKLSSSSLGKFSVFFQRKLHNHFFHLHSSNKFHFTHIPYLGSHSPIFPFKGLVLARLSPFSSTSLTYGLSKN